MTPALRQRCCFFFVLALGLVASGCGEKLVKPTGKVLKGGKALTLSDKGVLRVAFIKEGDATNTPLPANVNQKDATFEVAGINGKGIPPGKYRIMVEAQDPYPKADILKGQFSAKNTKIVQEVTGPGEITVEVGTPSKS
jgi:hypothetical protein